MLTFIISNTKQQSGQTTFFWFKMVVPRRWALVPLGMQKYGKPSKDNS